MDMVRLCLTDMVRLCLMDMHRQCLINLVRLCLMNDNNDRVLFYGLFLHIGAHRSLQSKEQNKLP